MKMILQFFKNAWDWLMGEIWIRIIYSKRKPSALVEKHKDIALSPDIENINREYCTFNPDNPPIVEFNGKKLPTYGDLVSLLTNMIHQDCKEVEHNVLRTTYIGVHDDALSTLEDMGILEEVSSGTYKLDWTKLAPFENIHIYYREKKKPEA